jgi:tol-pal system protein YbgF
MSFPFAARRFAFALVLVLVAAAPLAHAALFDDEEARKRIEATNQRLTQVQRAIEDRISALEVKVQSIVDLGNQMELLRGDFAKLRGNIEVLNYELEQAQKRQRDLYVDLDSRLRRLETAPPGAPAAAGGGAAEAPLAAPPSPPAGMPAPAAAAVPPAATQRPGVGGTVPPAVSPPPPVPPAAAPVPAASDAAAEQRAYDAALDLFKRGDYNGAVNGFGAFVKAYPKSPLAPSAQYWVGNAQYARRDYKAAITAQRTLVSAYPDSAKVPDALLNIATAQSELGDNASARRTLEDLIAKYPKSESAQKARQRLGMR